jgi:hypothetical protein
MTQPMLLSTAAPSLLNAHQSAGMPNLQVIVTSACCRSHLWRSQLLLKDSCPQAADTAPLLGPLAPAAAAAAPYVLPAAAAC